jgi:hypothetical protein
MTAGAETLTPEDRALLERLADRIVELRLEVPAILTLESGRPLSLLAIFFEPIVQALFRLGDYRRFSKLIESREALETLTTLIERRADAAHDARRAARRKPH